MCKTIFFLNISVFFLIFGYVVWNYFIYLLPEWLLKNAKWKKSI